MNQTGRVALEDTDQSSTKQARRAQVRAKEAAAREARMKANLRANLHRRKQKARALKQGDMGEK